MSCDPAGAATSPALHPIVRFCRARIFSRPRSLLAFSLAAAVFISALTAFASPSYRKRSTSGDAVSSSSAIPTFTLDQAVQRAFEKNPDILTARQEIERTKGLIIQVRAQALPHLDASAEYNKTDPTLSGGTGGFVGTTTGGTGITGGGTGVSPTPVPTASPSATPAPSPSVGPSATPSSTGSNTSFSATNNSYDLRFTASQLLYSGSVIPSLRAASIAGDSSLYSLRNVIDQTIATVRQQFYQVILNSALIGVQEESVQLLQSQLKDQQNRFEAGTVPRFNVLQAEVALANQQPALITARNNLRIAQLQLAKTIGLDYNPTRGNAPPLICKGELTYQPRDIPLDVAVELGKERRPFLKEERANILSQIQQVKIALGAYQPTLNLSGGYTFESSEFSDKLSDVLQGWFFGVTGSWSIFDGGAIYGNVKQARAMLSEAKIGYDNAVRQVELEIQQSYSNLQQDKQLVASQSKTVEQAHEALRLASARLSVGAGVQLDVLNAQVALTQAESTKLSALYSYNADLAEFDRVTATDTVYHDSFDDPLMRKHSATKFTTTTVPDSPRYRTPAAK